MKQAVSICNKNKPSLVMNATQARRALTSAWDPAWRTASYQMSGTNDGAESLQSANRNDMVIRNEIGRFAELFPQQPGRTTKLSQSISKSCDNGIQPQHVACQLTYIKLPLGSPE